MCLNIIMINVLKIQDIYERITLTTRCEWTGLNIFCVVKHLVKNETRSSLRSQKHPVIRPDKSPPWPEGPIQREMKGDHAHL